MRASSWLLIGLLFLFSCGTQSTAPTAKATIQGQVLIEGGPVNLEGGPVNSALGIVTAWIFTNPPTDTVKTDSLGRYVIDVPPGRYTLGAFDNDGGVTRSWDTVTAIAGRVDTVNLAFILP